MTKAHPLPNILTGLRLVAGLVMFAFLAGAAGGIPILGDNVTPEGQFTLIQWALYAFIFGALTDFFDGMAARRLNSETAWGATIDPIADKILVCGTILGIFSLGPQPHYAIPAALILFREFAVSALREAAASRGLKLKVTQLAKWKTTLQLVALGWLLFIQAWPAFGLPIEDSGTPDLIARVLMWIAAIVTVWTGWDYWRSASKVISHEA
jgi:CDP-diacylglycerol--glycerol-3-phosphate 3-phosphatidyltransferase